MNNILKQAEWLTNELINNANKQIAITVWFDKNQKQAKVYLNGEKTATISEEVCMFNFPLNNEQIAKLRSYLMNTSNENE